jgi:hypothetical protein
LTVSVVLEDANILFSRTLRDYVMYAADEGAIEIHWSEQILAEMSRNLRENLGFSHDDTGRLEQLMNDYIEYALLDVDPGHRYRRHGHRAVGMVAAGVIRVPEDGDGSV